jgi:peptidoglycan/LPS O-acetylase OafA/YrhL
MPNGFDCPTGSDIPAGTMVALVGSLFMLQTIVVSPFAILGATWSLSGEWWHYMLAPFLTKVSDRVLLLIILFSFIFFLKLHPAGPGVAGMANDTYGKAIIGLSWVWLSGFLYYKYRNTSRGAVLLFAPPFYAMTRQHSPGVPMFIAIFVLLLSDELQISFRLRKIFNLLGDYSYPLYLFHMPAMIGSVILGVKGPILPVLVAALVSLAALYGIDYPVSKFLTKKMRRKNDIDSSDLMPLKSLTT